MSPAAPRRSLPRTVWALGLVSLLMDSSSELVHALLPLYMTTVLGASMLEVGLIEGVAEGIAAITKVFSGTLSDWLGRRKLLVVLGYGLAALSKPLFPLANGIALVAGARFMDRIGKGIRGAPRDALIADVVALMALAAEKLRAVLWVAAAPALAAVLVLAFGVREPDGVRAAKSKSPLSKAMLGLLGARYWLVVGLGAVLTLARFSEAFLVLRAADVGLAQTWVPLVIVVMSAVYALASYPAGLAADRGWRRALIGWGLAALIAADLALGSAASVGAVFAGVALWGVHMGLTQGLLSALVADAAPAEARGTAFGVFNLFTGVVLIGASLLAGWLWQTHGPAATFYAGAGFTAVALAGLLAAAPRR
jgi:MFS family permease